MPKIENSSVLNQAKRVCSVLKKRGENLAAEHTATILVRALLEENGDLEMLNSTQPDDIAHRAALVTLAKQFCTASKNWQNTYASKTNGDDGQPLMPEVKATAEVVKAEFA